MSTLPPAPDPEPVFRVEKLCKIYRTGEIEVPALDGVDLTLAAGELVVLLGPSGSGESDLLNVVGGLGAHTSASYSSSTTSCPR